MSGTFYYKPRLPKYHYGGLQRRNFEHVGFFEDSYDSEDLYEGETSIGGEGTVRSLPASLTFDFLLTPPDSPEYLDKPREEEDMSPNRNMDERTPLLKVSHDSRGLQGERIHRDSIISTTPSCSQSSTSQSDDKEQSLDDHHGRCHLLRYAKIAILTGVVVFAVIALSFIEEKSDNWRPLAVEADTPYIMNLSSHLEPGFPVLTVRVLGSLLPEQYLNFSNSKVFVTLVRLLPNGTRQPIQATWPIPVAPARYAHTVEPSRVEKYFSTKNILTNEHPIQLAITTNEQEAVSLSVALSTHTELSRDGVIMAACVLVGLYVLIIFDLVHRTLAAMIGATAAIACLALIRERPTLEKVLTWLDVETLCLLFGMMVLVAILCETGFFDYVAVLAYRMAKGKVWPLVTTLCLLTAVISAFLDNVTTILLMTPVTIRLCEVMNLDPKHVLIALVLFSNIGGAATPVGDPPNVIIISNQEINQGGVDFASFTMHVLPGVVVCTIAAYFMLRFLYRKVGSLQFQDPPELVELRHEIEVWKKACHVLSGYSRDENTVRRILNRKVCSLENVLRKKLYDSRRSEEHYLATLEELSSQYKIRNKVLLVKTGFVLGVVILLFFLQSIPDLNLSLGWIAILGAIGLLILADNDDMESIIARVEWSTLLFFAALFVVMEAITELHFLEFIGTTTENWINSVDEGNRLLVAILLILWVSAIASSFIDNIPFTTMMVKIVTQLANNKDLGLPLTPLVYALAFGACLGGNGSLIGASANVVCAGVAEQHGYRFTFMDFFKTGFPVMILTIGVANVYLLICHVLLQWNS